MGDLAGEPFPRDWFEEPGEPVNTALVYGVWIGAKDHYPADRALAEAIEAIAPEVPRAARANRRFLERVVHHLAAQGFDQVVDLGAGLPAIPNVHDIAQAVRPDARVVYVDRDPVVIAHARALLGRDSGVTVIDQDLRDVPAVMAHPLLREALDLTRPVAVLMLAVLHFLGDADDPAGLVKEYVDHLPTGSVVVISHATTLGGLTPWLPPAPPASAPRVTWPLQNFFSHASAKDEPPRAGLEDAPGPITTRSVPAPESAPTAVPEERVREAARLYSRHASPITLRTAGDVRGLLGGLALDPPGVIPAQLWHPEVGDRTGAGDPHARPEPDADDVDEGIAPVLIAIGRTTR